jgi:ketosteroid isomerase-like protein
MSENLDLVRSVYAAWERGDFSSVEWADPEMEYVIPDGPNPGCWRGLAQIAHATRDILNAWEDFRFVADEYHELDRERVLVLDHNSGRGKASGVTIDDTRGEGAQLFRLRHGKVVRLVAYWDRDRALADLGLKE